METKHDVNTDAGFAAALAESVGRDPAENPETSETPNVSRGLEESAPDAPGRDPATGRFLPAGETPAAQEPEEPEAQEDDVPPEPAEDETPAATPEPGSIEEQLAHAQEVIGRQGEELGQLRPLREQMARLEGRLDQIGQQPQEAPELPGMDEEETDALGGMFQEHGVNTTMQWIMNNRMDLFDSALEMAGDYSVADATRWAWADAEAKGQLAREQTAPQQTQDEAWQQRAKLEFKMNNVLGEIKTLAGGEFDVIKDQIVPALANAPDIIKNAVISDDPTLRAQGVQALHELARAGAVQQGTKGVADAKDEAIIAAKKAAGLATGSGRAVPVRQPGVEPTEEERAERIKRFHSDILEAPTTSVADGLREGAGSR